MKKLALFAALISFSGAQFAAEPIRLYKQFLVGTPKKNLQKILPFKPCVATYETGTLCLQNHTLAGETAEIAFRFLNDKLVGIVLMMPIKNVAIIKKMFYVLKTRFDLALIQDGSEKLDILQLGNDTFSNEEFGKIIANFENEAYEKRQISYVFIDQESFDKQVRTARNFAQIFENAPLKMRTATYSIARKKGQVMGSISFLVPGIDADYLEQNPIVEDF